MTWATNHDASLERLRRVQGSLTVDLIMVPRDDFREFCTTDETAAQIMNRNAESYSYLPVVDGRGRIMGLYHAERWFSGDAPDTPIRDDFEPLSEDIVIGADASIFDFMMQAEGNPTNLVVSGNRITGLVSLSDLQQLPVRAALFTLTTSLEMAMALAIERHWAERSDDWLDILTDGPRKAIERGIRKAKKSDGFVNRFVFARLKDKADVICHSGLLGSNDDDLTGDFDEIRSLRNKLAHADEYATTPEDAKAVCALVRKVFDIKERLAFVGIKRQPGN